MITRTPHRASFWPPCRGTASASCVLWLPGQDDPQSITIRDRSGNGNHGTITGATWKKTPRGLSYLDYDGTDDLTTVTITIASITAITFKTWVRLDTDPGSGTNLRPIVGDVVWRGLIRQCVAYSPANFVFLADSSESGTKNARYSLAADGLWHHLVGTYASSRCKLYFDSVLKDTATVDDTFSNIAALNIMGVAAATRWLDGGNILSLILNGVAWSEAEITSNYRQERGLFGV